MADRGAAVLYTTHIGSDAELADNVLFMLNGEIVARGSPEQLISRYTPELVATLTVDDIDGFRGDAEARGVKIRMIGDKLIATVRDESQLAELAKIAARHGLRMLEVRRPGLEDAFLVATGVPLSEVTAG